MDDVELGEYSFVGAGSLVTPGKKIPPGVLVMGSPAKIIRDINEKEREIITRTATNYQKYKDNYLNQETFKLLQ
jgi:carbonic anhydrase/acetyltransferase-like protein (isoleucine patch superfamily)